MDYLTVVIVSGKALYINDDNRSRKQVVRRERVVTSTGAQSQACRKRQHLFLTLAGASAK
jgi:hypothetical protein